MKKTWKSVIAVILTVGILLGATATAVYAGTPRDSGIGSIIDYISGMGSLESKETQAGLLNRLSNFFLNDLLLKAVSVFIPRMPNSYKLSKFDFEEYGGFYEGHESFISGAGGGTWSLGYDKKSIIPADFGKPFKYARGSYVPWWYSTEVYKDDDGKTEFVGVRTIVIDDGTGRGAVSFSVVDCIGFANADVRKIRAAIADFAAENHIVSVNVSATHTHSGIDSQGAWNGPLSTLANNIASAFSGGLIKMKSGVNETYLNTIINQTVASIKAAYAGMTKGELHYASKDIANQMHDRTPPYVYDGNMYRLTFQPFDKKKTPTLIASVGCHPEAASYDFLITDGGFSIDTKISGDSVYYMEKLINKAGYNFIFIQGNVGTVTSDRGPSSDGIQGQTSHQSAIRFGYELGYILLGMTENEAGCIKINNATGDLLGVNDPNRTENYTVWYKDWKRAKSEKVYPVLNIAHKQFLTELENNMAKLLAKSGLADITVIYDAKTAKYYTVTEVGYMEIGGALKVFLSPGELYGELFMGDPTMADFPYKPLRELFGENLIIFDLMNDAAGYVEPDNEYVIVGYRYNEKKDELESDSWALLVSLGKNAASDMVGAFIDLVKGVNIVCYDP